MHEESDPARGVPHGRRVTLPGRGTTLVRDVLLPLLEARQTSVSPSTDADETEADSKDDSPTAAKVPSARLEGFEAIDRVVLVDQTSLGKTPRSNPVVYVGAFEHIRNLFAETDLAKQRGLNSSGFSFNSGQGQCDDLAIQRAPQRRA